MKYLVVLCVSLCMLSCGDDIADNTDIGPVPPELEVVYLDILNTCGWNLLITNEETLADVRGRRDSFLLSDIPEFNTNGQFAFGDTLYVEVQVIDPIPDHYERSNIICNRWNGIPVRLLSVRAD